MDAGGAAGQGDIQPVVDEQRNAGLLEPLGDLEAELDERSIGQVLRSKLDDGHPALDGRLDERGQVTAGCEIGVGDEIKRIIDSH